MRKAKVWDARQLPAYLTVAQYGELMGICPKTVRRMCQRGELPAHKEGPRLWRIEIKKVAEGQIALGIEAKNETPDEVLTCAARGFVGVARNLLGPMATNPQFAEEISRGIKGMLLDTEDLKVTRGVEGKEAKFIAALYGMNAGGEK